MDAVPKRTGRNKGTLNTGGTYPNAGRPVVTIKATLKKYLDQGYEPATQADVVAAYELLLAMDAQARNEVAADNTQPGVLQFAAKMLNERGADYVERMLDRAHGKATQTQQLTGADGGAISFTLAPADPAQLAGLNIETNAD